MADILERWLPFPGREYERLEVSDLSRVRRASRYRGLGQTIRLEPILDAAEIAALQLDVAAAFLKAFGVAPAAEVPITFVPVEVPWEHRVGPGLPFSDTETPNETITRILAEAIAAEAAPSPAVDANPPSETEIREWVDAVANQGGTLRFGPELADASPSPAVDASADPVIADPAPAAKPRGRRPPKANS